MNSKQKAFTIRVPTELYENVSEMAESLDISITQVVRAAITQYCIQSGSSMNASGSTVNANGSDSGSDGEDSTHFLQQQLESKDTQISELHRLLALQSEHNVLLTTKESLFGRIRGFFTGSKVIGSGV
ncbi:MAG: ribbon-helix-helix protein, CopG family [Candidatus Poribacteria bacterium]